MFADACQKAMEYTRPVVKSVRHLDGSVVTECASMIVLNSDGWFMTAAHIYDSFVKFQSDQNKLREIEALNRSKSSRPGSPSTEVKPDPESITNHSIWWGWDGVRTSTVMVNRQLDVLVGRLEPFDPSWVREYPVLIDPDHVRPGTSLCRGGFSFSKITSTFDEERNAFRIPKIPHRDVMFFNDGIHSRNVDMGPTKDGKFRMSYVETSTPGLKGQSGGPIFDREGRLYAMQVRTRYLPVGIHPTAEYEGRTVVENQFLGLGLGIQPATIRSVLDFWKVRYAAEGDDTGFRIIG